jgi:hypothetical protein
VIRRRHVPLVVAVILSLAVVGGLLFVENQPWREGSRHGPWLTVFTGYGQVRGSDDGLELTPRPATSTERTHAALVVSAARHGDVAITADIRTESQLRRGDPNAWEVGWVLWHYSSPTRFYAVALKPNGWELSKQDPDAPGGQRFLASGLTPKFPVGASYSISVVQVGPVIKVSAEGKLLTAYTDTESPYLDGRVGFYTEDAKVVFRQIRLTDVGHTQVEGSSS